MGIIWSKIFPPKEDNSAAVKKQAEGASNPMYALASLTGTGMLYEMCKKAMISKNYKELDEAIKQKLPPYLYNGGKGEWIHCAQIACIRNSIRPPSKQFPFIRELPDPTTFKYGGSELLAKLLEGQSYETHPHLYTQHCWDVENRGCVGETVFHVCFLQGTTIHLHLAKRLLMHFPLLLNDIYLSDEYYGENVLHMSCVAEDPSVVKWLLDIGADFNRRCYGNFFTCHDQQPFRTDSLEMEEVVLRDQTDYYGYVAWGEYSHCFAAVLNQEECYRLILAKGGNPDMQDINGCTVTHILVVFDNMKMFDMAVECGAAINIPNKLKLTPLTVAAYLAKMDMFFHIASIEREVYWQLGNVVCSAYPLKNLDTIHSETGELQTVSALNLIVFGQKLEHLDLIEYVIVDLLKVKWNSFVKRTFYTQFFIFVMFFFLSSCCFVLREQTPLQDEEGGNCTMTNMTSLASNFTNNITDVLNRIRRDTDSNFIEDAIGNGSLSEIIRSSGLSSDLPSVSGVSGYEDMEVNMASNMTEADMCEDVEDFDFCFHNNYDSLQKQIRLVLEIILAVWSLLYLVKAGHEYTFLGKRIWMDNMKMCPSRVVFLLGCITVLAMVPFRLLCVPDVEDVLAIISMFCHGFYFLFFCRGIKLVGPMVTMIYRMMMQDLARFGTVFFIFVMGFSQAYFIIFLSFEEQPDCEENDDDCVADNLMPDFVESILMTFLMSLGEVMEIWTALGQTSHTIIGKLHWFLFVMVVYILLLNLLIAMMGDTYAKIAAIKNEWMRQWARVVLIVERTVPPKERLRMQDLYADRNSDGDKALVMKQFLSDEKIDEINEIIEMKITHRKNIDRRKTRFGFESTSKMGLNMAGAAVIIPDGSDGTDPENPYADEGTTAPVNF